MKIQLDTKALEALFPEGSEQRIELQNAVISNFASKMKDNWIASDIRTKVQEALRESGEAHHVYDIQRKTLGQMLEHTSGWSSAAAKLKQNSSLAEAIRVYSREQCTQLNGSLEEWAREFVDTHIGKREEQGKMFIERYVEQAERQIEKAKQQAFDEIESRIVAECKRSMPEIIRREMANYLNAKSPL